MTPTVDISTCCRECGHLHDDYCDAAVLEHDNTPALCGCPPDHWYRQDTP